MEGRNPKKEKESGSGLLFTSLAIYLIASLGMVVSFGKEEGLGWGTALGLGGLSTIITLLHKFPLPHESVGCLPFLVVHREAASSGVGD